MIKPFGKSFLELWNGRNKATSIVGKSVITAAGAATLTAMLLLTSKNSARFHKIVNFKTQENKNEVQK